MAVPVERWIWMLWAPESRFCSDCHRDLGEVRRIWCEGRVWISHVGLLRALEAIPAEMRIAVRCGLRAHVSKKIEVGDHISGPPWSMGVILGSLDIPNWCIITWYGRLVA